MGNAHEIGYTIGFILGKFVLGAAFGLFPLIVAIIKKHTLMGVGLMVVCGLLSLIHPFAATAAAVVLGIVLCFIRKNG